METNKPLIDLVCEECGNDFKYHRKKKYCDTCSETREKQKTMEYNNWMKLKRKKLKEEKMLLSNVERYQQEIQKKKQSRNITDIPTPQQKEIANIIGLAISWLGTLDQLEKQGKQQITDCVYRVGSFKLSEIDKVNLRKGLELILSVIVANPGERDINKYHDFFSEEFKEKYGDALELHNE